MNKYSQPTPTPVIADALNVVRRRLPLILSVAPAVLLLAIFLAFALPAKFQSTATILLEPSSVPKEMIKTSVVSYSNQQIELVQGRVMTLDTLEELVKSYDPYPEDTQLSARKKARQVLEDTSIERVDPVTMEPLVESNAFSLHYDNPDPERAAEVASRLAQLFLTYNQRIRAEAAQQATQFLKQQSEAINAKMREIDGELARLKSEAGEAFPELQARNQSTLERNERDLAALQQQILSAEAKESLLALQLSQLSPNLMTQSGDLTDLATVRAKLAEAEQRYTADHPQVKRLRKALETLVAQSAGGGRRAAGANNPQYMTTASQLDSVRRELANLRSQANRSREQMSLYTQLIQRTPEVEKQYAEIQRRKDSVQAEYQQIYDKLQSAQLAQSFETEQRGERFTLLRTPSEANSPVSPNRVGLILLGFVLACGLAAASVAVVESVDSNVRHARDLPELKGVTLLASIPVIHNSADQRRRRIWIGSYAAAYGLMLALVGVTVVSALY
jgi:succinoglycan biosynthesis transport protein ExoP